MQLDSNAWDASNWLVMSLMMLLFWGGMIALVAWIVHSTRSVGNEKAPRTDTRADEVLAERYARGEIDDQEFTRRSAMLRGFPLTPRS